MVKSMRSRSSLAVEAISFAVRTTFSNLFLILQSLCTIGIMWLIVFLVPLITIVHMFNGYYGVDIIQSASVYLNDCIPAQNCTWSDFIALITKAHEQGGVGMPEALSNSLERWGILLGVLHIVFLIWAQCGIVNICLGLYNKKKVTMQAFMTNVSMILRAFMGYLVGVIAFGGMIFALHFSARLFNFVGILIVLIPMLWVIVRYSLFLWFLVDRNASMFSAFRQSFNATRGHVGDIFKVWLFATVPMIGVSFLSRLSLTLGWMAVLLVAIPIFNLSMTYLYRRLTKRAS